MNDLSEDAYGVVVSYMTLKEKKNHLFLNRNMSSCYESNSFCKQMHYRKYILDYYYEGYRTCYSLCWPDIDEDDLTRVLNEQDTEEKRLFLRKVIPEIIHRNLVKCRGYYGRDQYGYTFGVDQKQILDGKERQIDNFIMMGHTIQFIKHPTDYELPPINNLKEEVHLHDYTGIEKYVMLMKWLRQMDFASVWWNEFSKGR